MQRLGVDRSGMLRLGQAGAAVVGITIPDPAPEPVPELADGVWNPAPDTWAANVERYVDVDARIHVVNEVQVPFATFPSENDWPKFSVDGYDPRDFMTRIIEFTAPMQKLVAGDDPIRVITYEGGTSYQQIEYYPGQNDKWIGLYVFYRETDNTRQPLTYVHPGQTLREVVSLMQIDNHALGHNSQNATGPVVTDIVLPDGYVFPLRDFTVNPLFEHLRIGYVPGSPLGTDLQSLRDGTDPGMQWLRDASYRGTDIMDIPMFVEPARAQPQTLTAGGQTLNANGVPIVATG